MRIERTDRVELGGEQPIVERKDELPIVPLDPKGSGPIEAKVAGTPGAVRIEAPWSARARELVAIALEKAKHRPEREAIEIALSSILEAPELRGAKVGIGVEDDSGILFSRELDTSLNPASNAKLCTATYVLGALKPSHRFITEARRIGGDVYLIGAFDPSMTTETLAQIAAGIAEKTKSIDTLFLDVSRFEEGRTPAGFDRYGDQDWQYLARPEALSVNKNLLAFAVRPGEQVGDPAVIETDQQAFAVDSTVKTIAPRSKFKMGIDEVDGQPIIELKGEIALDYAKGKELVMKSPDPMASFEDEIRRALTKAGIEVGRIDRGPAPPGGEKLYQHRSAPLRELLQESIATSNAFDHEMYALAAASGRDGRATSLSDARVHMERFLREEIGLGDPQLENASGIGNLDRISARDVLKILGRAAKDPQYGTLLGALAQPGQDGTLKTRMLGTAAEKLLRAKTGTGDDAVALSGTIGSKKTGYRFTVLIDDQSTRDGARAVLDAIGIALSEIRSSRARRSRL